MLIGEFHLASAHKLVLTQGHLNIRQSALVDGAAPEVLEVRWRALGHGESEAEGGGRQKDLEENCEEEGRAKGGEGEGR